MSDQAPQPDASTTPPAAVPAGYVPYGPPAKASKSSAMSKAGTSIMVSLFLVSLLANVYALLLFNQLFAGSERVLIEGDTGTDDRIAVVYVDGMITNETAAFVNRTLRQFAQGETMPRAIVMRIESGGGSVGASDRIWHDIKQFKAQHNVPVIASFGSVAASGGYYIAAPTDYIFCEATGVTGSIGVMAQVFTADGLLEKVGVTPEILVADGSPRKDVANDITRPWNEADREVVRDLLNNAHRRFVDVVAEGRTQLSRDQVVKLANGDIFTADEAVAAKLVDEVGYLESAIDYAASKAGFDPESEPTVTAIRPSSGGLLSAISGRTSAPSASFDLADGKRLRDTLVELTTPRLEYRWSALQP